MRDTLVNPNREFEAFTERSLSNPQLGLGSERVAVEAITTMESSAVMSQ